LLASYADFRLPDCAASIATAMVTLTIVKFGAIDTEIPFSHEMDREVAGFVYQSEQDVLSHRIP